MALFSVGGAVAASGTAIGVDPDAEARGRTNRTLVVGADIFIGDRIVTDASGLVQIVFSDTTRLVVGPRSSLVIDDYLLRDNGSAGKFAINALSGTFRFITGDAPKDRYIITTPTGQIGVRGTVFDLFSSKSAAYVMQLRGATINCPKGGGDCGTLRDRCEVIELTSGEADNLGKPASMSGSMRREARGWFPFSASQRILMRPFRVSGAENCLKPDNTPPESLFDIDLARPRNNDSYE
jgi:hypothetical protein